MRIPVSTTLLLAALFATACSPADEQPAPAIDAAAVADADADPAAPPAGATDAPPATPADPGMLDLQPAALPECGDPAAVTVTWDARAARVSGVDIIAVNRAGKESLFFTGGARGSRVTGEWMRSGSQLVLRDADDGTELDRAMVGATPCVDGVPSQ